MANIDIMLIAWKDHQPERYARAQARQAARIAKKLMSGRAGKDALMPKARSVATSGACSGWLQVLTLLERLGTDTALLRIWATAGDKDEIDRLCRQARSATKR